MLFVPFGNLGALSNGFAQELASHGHLVVLAEPSVNLPDAGDEQASAEVARLSEILDHLVAGADSDSIGVADAGRLAVGGHSSGGSLAFEMALIDPRVAVFDLDGALVRDASTRAVTIPALVVMTSLGLGGHRDNFPETFSVLASTQGVAVVGLEGADHFDVLDAPTVAPVLEAVSASWPLGPIGAIATTSTAELVRRFLDGALSQDRSTPSTASLAADVPGATDSAEFLALG